MAVNWPIITTVATDRMWGFPIITNGAKEEWFFFIFNFSLVYFKFNQKESYDMFNRKDIPTMYYYCFPWVWIYII